MSGLERAAATLLVVASMIAVGLELDGARMRAIRAQGAWVVRAMIVSLGVVPLAAALVLAVLPLDVDARTGLALAACAPGGASATVLALRARADAAMTAALVVVATLTSGVATPILVAALAPGGLTAGSFATVLPVAAIATALQLVPLGLAALARARLGPDRAAAAAKIANRVANALLLGLVVGLAVTRWRSVVSMGPSVLAAAAVLTSVALVASRAMARRAGRSTRDAIAIASAVRSLSLALALAATQYSAPRTTEAILVYGLAMYVVTGVAAEHARRAPPAPA